MKARWCLGVVGGGFCALSLGGAASTIAFERPLDSISLGMLVTLCVWIALWVWVMATEQLGRCAMLLGLVFVLGTALCVWGIRA